MDLNKYIEQLQGFDVNDIDWERVGVWPLIIRVLMFVVAAIVIIVACHFLFVKERKVTLEREVVKESELRKSFENKAFEAANLDKYRQQMIEMEESFGALKSRLPKDTEVPGLLEDIDDKGLESRATINSVDLLPEISTEFYIELPINISVSGGFHEFGAFISGVAGMPRIVTLHNFSIAPESAKNGIGALTMDITAKTYRYKPQGDEEK